MKTNILFGCLLGATVAGLSILGTGCRETKAAVEPNIVAAPATSPLPATVSAPAAPPTVVEPVLPAPNTNAPVVTAISTSSPMTAPIVISNPSPEMPAAVPAHAQVVQEAIVPEIASVSPTLSELVKMIHSGVTEDVLISYVTNSSDAFYVGADQVVYLKDIGATPALITTLLQHESQPQIVAKRHAAAAVKPLPEGVAVNTPVPQIYPGQSQPPKSEPTPVTTTFQASAEPPPPSGAQPTAVEAPQAAVETASFYTSLAPYGTWVDIPDYGYCWRPTVAIYNAGWSPYCNDGRWLWSDYGWYWYSDYSWGWAPFHYGRWCSYPGYGWIWNPGTVWGPAWVTWSYNNSYCGWAPLPPACGYTAGIGLTWGGGAVGVGFGFGLAASCYTYVGWNNFCSPYPNRYCAPRGAVQNIYNNCTFVNNYVAGSKNVVINKGVGTERISGPIPRATIRETARSGGKISDPAGRRETLHKDGTLNVYRPEYIGASGLVSSRTTAPAGGSSVARVPFSSSARPAGSERVLASQRGANTSAAAGIANAPAGSATATPRATSVAPTSRFQETPRTTTPGATRGLAPSRTSPTVYPGGRSTTPSASGSTSVGVPSKSFAPVTPSGTRTVPATPSGVSRPTTAPSSTMRPVSPAPSSVSRPSSAPSYRAPAPSSSPTPTYRAPSAPAPSYRAPSSPSYTPRSSAPANPGFSAPAARSAPSYSAPVARPAPSYSAPANRSTPSGGRGGRD